MENADLRLDDVIGLYASLMATASGSLDPRLERVFKLVPREAFLPPGPWTIIVVDGGKVRTPSADPIHLYQNVLIALDLDAGINNGEPLLHARWIGAVAPQPGDRVTHIGAGTGYYSAILSVLVLPGGDVTAFELHSGLAAAAARNLEPFDNVTVVAGDAVARTLPPSDVIYVNAGVVAPPLAWLEALKPGGRMIFPWRPTQQIGLAVMIRRVVAGFTVEPLMHSYFIPCVGASEAPAGSIAPTYPGAWDSRSVRMTRDETPDGTATAVYDDLWFSSSPAGVSDLAAVAK